MDRTGFLGVRFQLLLVLVTRTSGLLIVHFKQERFTLQAQFIFFTLLLFLNTFKRAGLALAFHQCGPGSIP